MKFSNKYVPTNVEEVVGERQKQVLQVLLESDEPKQTVLFTGDSGTGKTSVARIYAASLLDIPLSELDEHIDFSLINAREVGIDYFRETLLGESQYPPVIGEYKVFLFDEVHALHKTNQQTIILNWLENIPKHIVVMFATNYPEKLNKALLSRINPHYNFTSPTKNQLKHHMLRLFKLEGLTVEENITGEEARQVLESAQGNIRTLNDKIQDYVEGTFKPITTKTTTGFVRDFYAGMAVQKAFTELDKIDNYAGTLEQLCRYGLAILATAPRGTKKGKRAWDVINIFGAGLPQNVSEKVGFGYLLTKYFEKRLDTE